VKEGLALFALVVVAAVYRWTEEPAPEQLMIEQSASYSGCDEVRALGKDPIYQGQPGYRPEMDGDGDGIACEPYRGR
jgi:hypothetical protein